MLGFSIMQLMQGIMHQARVHELAVYPYDDVNPERELIN